MARYIYTGKEGGREGGRDGQVHREEQRDGRMVRYIHIYSRRQKKFPFTVCTTERAIPFHSRLISVPLPFVPRPFSSRSHFVLRAAHPFN